MTKVPTMTNPPTTTPHSEYPGGAVHCDKRLHRQKKEMCDTLCTVCLCTADGSIETVRMTDLCSRLSDSVSQFNTTYTF